MWPIALQERGKTEKEELTLLKSPVFGSSKMALINCSRLLIGWEGERWESCLTKTNPAHAHHTQGTKPHTCLYEFLYKRGELSNPRADGGEH